MAVTIQHAAQTDLTAKQRQGAHLLACGASKKATAETLKVAAHTISQWCKSLSFNDAVNQHLASVESEALQILKSQRLRAAEALGELLDSKAPAVRLAAARTVLEITTSKTPPPTEASAKFAAVLALLESTP